jgi:hypothetical protein
MEAKRSQLFFAEPAPTGLRSREVFNGAMTSCFCASVKGSQDTLGLEEAHGPGSGFHQVLPTYRRGVSGLCGIGI